MIVQLQEATQYYYYRAALAIFPLTPDQIRAQIWPNGVRGRWTKWDVIVNVTDVLDGPRYFSPRGGGFERYEPSVKICFAVCGQIGMRLCLSQNSMSAAMPHIPSATWLTRELECREEITSKRMRSCLEFLAAPAFNSNRTDEAGRFCG